MHGCRRTHSRTSHDRSTEHLTYPYFGRTGRTRSDLFDRPDRIHSARSARHVRIAAIRQPNLTCTILSDPAAPSDAPGPHPTAPEPMENPHAKLSATTPGNRQAPPPTCSRTRPRIRPFCRIRDPKSRERSTKPNPEARSADSVAETPRCTARYLTRRIR